MAADGSKIEAGPYTIDVEAGKSYVWCKCGHSKGPPLCDGSQGANCEKVQFVAKKTETVILCGCTESGDPPYCDGTHNII